VIFGIRSEVDENSALWVITQGVVLISYRRYGITFRSNLQGQESLDT
jgi:hypothetical protein